MMKDWTDIIGEELESIQEPLPADDWKVLQQKYTASRRKRRIAAFAWAGGIASAAAVVVLALLLMYPDTPVTQNELVADSIPVVADSTPAVDVVPEYAVANGKSSIGIDAGSLQEDAVTNTIDVSSSNSTEPADTAAASIAATDEITEEGKKEETVGILNDTSAVVQRLIADAVPSDKQTESEETGNMDAWDLGELPDEKVVRKRIPVSIGITGTVSERLQGVYRAALDGAVIPENSPVTPPDTLKQEKLIRTKGENGPIQDYLDTYDHEIPVSFGVSARIFLNKRFAVNTGLHYTKYTSTRKRYFYKNGETIRDKQNVHYIGIPLRLDWMIVNRKHFNLYLGWGINADKCIYATIGNERLREREVIVSSIFTAGLQVNIVPSVGLYFEPYISRPLMLGTLNTLRNDNTMISAQGGLRFNF